MKKVALRLSVLLCVGGLALLVTGCVSTFKDVQPLSSGPPPTMKPRALALGELKITDARLSQPERDVMAHAFELGIEKWYAEHKTLEVLRNVSSTNLPPGAILLRGTITEVEKGSAAARFWVGMGAGKQRALGEFTLQTSEGTNLLAFSARKSYLGGTGIGGFDMLKLEELLDQLGQLVAETIDKWLRDGKIK